MAKARNAAIQVELDKQSLTAAQRTALKKEFDSNIEANGNLKVSPVSPTALPHWR